MKSPTKPGTYLLLAYEWAGLRNHKPLEPEWSIRKFTYDGTVGSWQRKQYFYDTGGITNLEVVRWTTLPEGETDEEKCLRWSSDNEAVLTVIRDEISIDAPRMHFWKFNKDHELKVSGETKEERWRRLWRQIQVGVEKCAGCCHYWS